MLTATDSLGTFVQTLFVDYQKPFDHLDHYIIMLKLKQMGVPDILVKWISSILHERRQQIKIGQSKSDRCEITGDVPQSTKIGVLLFQCMINDLQPSPN